MGVFAQAREVFEGNIDTDAVPLGFTPHIRGNGSVLTEAGNQYSEVIAGNLRSDSAVPKGDAGMPIEAGYIVIIEPRVFVRDCLGRCMLDKFVNKIVTYSSIVDFERDLAISSARAIILSFPGTNEIENGQGQVAIGRLLSKAPATPVIVLAPQRDVAHMRVVFKAGASGYIPLSMEFNLAIEAVKFVLAGGTYIPADMLTAEALEQPVRVTSGSHNFTSREISVMRAIRLGKANKVIAYDLNMCESTVKVHVRNIMKKLGVKNRTAVAMLVEKLLR